MEGCHHISRQCLQLMGFSSSTATQGEIGVLEAQHFPQRGTTGLWKGTRGKEREGGKEISFIIPHSPLVFLSSLNDTHYSSTKCCKCLQCDWCEGCLRGHIVVPLPHGAEHLHAYQEPRTTAEPAAASELSGSQAWNSNIPPAQFLFTHGPMRSAPLAGLVPRLPLD